MMSMPTSMSHVFPKMEGTTSDLNRVEGKQGMSAELPPITPLADIVLRSSKRTYDIFSSDGTEPVSTVIDSQRNKISAKLTAEYAHVKKFVIPTEAAAEGEAGDSKKKDSTSNIIQSIHEKKEEARFKSGVTSTSLVLHNANQGALSVVQPGQPGQSGSAQAPTTALAFRRPPPKVPKPQWHPPWKMSSVIAGHLGWVRCVAFDPSNEWFVTGAADRTIKIWDLAKCSAGVEGGLKLTLTGHISTVRGVTVSNRHPYLFSVGEDKTVKCWDLEQNKVIRHYHGHLSAVYCCALHPTLDLLITGGRDSVARVWDMRSKVQIHVLGEHSDVVGTLATNAVDPQVITGSYDKTIKLWDLTAGKSMVTLTNHKKAVRDLKMHPKEFSFLSASQDNLKKWQAKDGKFLKNFEGHNAVVNTLAINEDGVVASGGDNGSMHMWDYQTGYCFQKTETIVQPGSLDSEAGFFASAFDVTGTRLLTCEADKTIKIWKEDPDATEETHPIDMKGWTQQCLAPKRF